jgi:hypothetical protein
MFVDRRLSRDAIGPERLTRERHANEQVDIDMSE